MSKGRKIAAAVLATAAAPLTQGASAPDTIGAGPLYALGVATSDDAATAQQYERVFGVKATPFGVASNMTPDGARNEISMSVVPLANFYVKLQKPVSQTGPFAQHLKAHGTSIMNLQMQVADAQAVRRRLEPMGGRWVLGSAEDFWGYVDLRDRLGAILEPINMRPQVPVQPLPGVALALGTMPVTHVSVAVSDVNRAAASYAELFGIPVPEVHEVTWLKALQGSANPAPRLRIARWKQGDIGIELVEADGSASPWSELATRHGNAAIGLAFDVGDNLDKVRGDLRKKGGILIGESADGNTAYFDFLDTLGMIVEISGKQG